jgi:predicted nucleic acid-binding protein
MSYLLDTTLLSELVKRSPDPNVVAWFTRQDEEALFVSVLTIGELQKGISKLVDSHRRTILQEWLSQHLAQRFAQRLLPIDNAVALKWGVLQGEAEQRGTPLPVIDCLLAATADIHNLAVVTRNTGVLQRCGARVVNPWQP